MHLVYKLFTLLVRATRRICRDVSSYFQKLNLKSSGVQAHWKSMRLYGRNIWDIKPGADVVFGENFVCVGGADLTIDLFVGSKVYVSGNGTLHIGDNFGMSSCSIQCCNNITIGNNVLLGVGCLLIDSDFHDLDYKVRRINHGNRTAKSYPIMIGDDVFVGARSIICKGVTIGSRSIIAAGSVVKHNIPEDEIWGGNPATFIKKINNN